MKNQIYYDYISSLLQGKLTRNTISLNLYNCFDVLFTSIIYSELVGSINMFDDINFLIVTLLPLILGLIFFILLYKTTSSNTITCNQEDFSNIDMTSDILEIIPVNKKSIISSRCIDIMFSNLYFISFAVFSFLFFPNTEKMEIIRGIIVIFTAVVSLILTYKNIKTFKVVPKVIIKPTKFGTKGENFLTRIMDFAFILTIIFPGSDFLEKLANQFPEASAILANFILNFSLFNTLGSLKIGLLVTFITLILTIYFNYFYILKKKLSQLDTVSNWREL